MRRLTLWLVSGVIVGAASVSGASAPMVLTRSGDLYSILTQDDQIIVPVRHADSTVETLVVPQSAGAVEGSLHVDVDEASGALYVLWQRADGMDARLRLAVYTNGTWIGPRTLAGNDDGTSASNPVMLVHRSVTEETSQVDENGGAIVTEIATSFLHLAWWSKTYDDDPGLAMYAAIELRDDGIPEFSGMKPVELYDLMPYGVGCFLLQPGDNLRHPRIFIDPQSGRPHLFVTDLGSCHFQILELAAELEDEVNADATGKRRRQIIILRNAAAIALRPDLPLATGSLKVGSNLKLLIHWDAKEEVAIRYLELDEAGSSEIRNLPLGEHLSHEQAVALIHELAH